MSKNNKKITDEIDEKKSNKFKKSLFLISKKSDTSYPCFNQYLWINLIEKYLAPADCISLALTCKKLYVLITTKMNNFWHYKLLEKTGKLILHSYQHKSVFTGCCIHTEHRKLAGLPESWFYPYPGTTNVNNLPTYEEYNDIMKQPLSEDLIEQLNYIKTYMVPLNKKTKNTKHTRYFRLPSSVDVEGVTCHLCPDTWSSHWTRVYYPYGHPIYSSYSAKIDYYQRYIYNNYYTNRIKILTSDFSKALYTFKRAEFSFNEAKTKLDKYKFFMQKFYQESPELFTSKNRHNLEYFDIHDTSKDTNTSKNDLET